ncbi:hypothetical protein L6164_037309 [Bauhinia variegata]|uniref:Uncharacterized protein n=1 Tax=Bauhinia variegata TaxID=167791 RepID=A0ACB9KKF5_BAUVA|nr:hypothetical protein L6164_037309 [Bauhinia variegata]
MSSEANKKDNVQLDLANVENKEEATKLKIIGPSRYLKNLRITSMRERDFSVLISTYLSTSQYYSSIDSVPPYLRSLVPEDILNKIRKQERYIFQGKQVLEDVVEAPDPILNLATDLAVGQLIQVIKDEFRFRFSNVRMTTRTNVEKRAVLAKIEAALNKENMIGSGKRLERVISVDVSKCKNDHEVLQELVAELGLHTIDELREIITKRNYLLLLMDGDGDQNKNPWEAGRHEYNKKTFAVFITTESSAARRKFAFAFGEIEIRTEDHLLPWVVFCRNVGCDLVRSSTGIHRIAVQIVEECRCHLHVDVMVGRLLKNVQDVEIWEHTLKKLQSTSPEVKIMEGASRVMVNAFIIFWESLDPIKKDCLKICLSRVYDSDLKSKWIHYGLLQTEQEAEEFLEELLSYSFLEEKSSYFPDENIYFREEINQTLKSLNKLNLPVTIESKSHNHDAWHTAVVVDAQLSDLPLSPNCPHLRAVVLKDNPDLTEIPQLFFQQMPVLRTLYISQTSLRNLPSSVINLMELKVLKLSNCKLFRGLPPEIGQLNNLENIHLDGTQIAHLPPSPNWPHLTELFLQDNPHLTELPPLFFNHIPLLQDLNLSSTSIKELPHSFSNLMNLRRLYLSDCELFRKLPQKIGVLKCLNELYLDGTYLLHLQKEVKELVNLKSLALCFYGSSHDTGRGENNMQLSNSTVIPAGVISNLKSLYSLSIYVNFDDKRWHENVQIILPEITGLEKLSVLKLYIPKVELLGLMSTCIARLHQFEFIVGHQMQQRIISRAPPAVASKLRQGKKSLNYFNGVDIPWEISVALQKVDTFFLDRHATIKDLSAFGFKNLHKLRVCVLGECNQMHTIADGSRSSSLRYMLWNLEFLGVFYMKNLKSIFKGVSSPQSFMMKSLQLYNCPKLKTIFTLNFVDDLFFLEEVVIEDCPKVSTLISYESSKQQERSFLPNLRKVSLLYLPKLVTISGGLHIGPKLEKIGFYYCPKLKSLSMLELSSNYLKVIKGETRWWKRLNWSQAGWEQNQADHLKKIFSPIDEERDIMTQLTTDEDDTVKNDANDTYDDNGDDDNYDDLDDDDTAAADDDVSEEEDEYADE